QPEKAVKAVEETGIAVCITSPIPPPGFFFVLTFTGSTLSKLNPYQESGKLKVLVDPKSPYPFDKVNKAFTYLETHRTIGKIVIYPIP
ncbi:hypothetical protein Tco_1117101, partial [Tanacetum coccineum]